jgi:hypothetical protein
MKKLLSLLVLAAVLAGVNSPAAILIGSLSTITTAQTNSTTILTNTSYVSIPQVTVSNNVLAITNAYSGLFRFSIDNGTTWFTNNSPVFIPTATNAASYTVYAQTVQIPIQIQLVAITNTANTSTIQIGVTTP